MLSMAGKECGVASLQSLEQHFCLYQPDDRTYDRYRRNVSGAAALRRKAKKGSDNGKHCRFCGSASHAIAGCELHKGMRYFLSELGKFGDELSDGRMVSQPLPPTVQRPFLEIVPNDTKWLVFHRHFQIVAGAPPNNSKNRLAEVTFYGKTGK
jgi:hypothetical protein